MVLLFLFRKNMEEKMADIYYSPRGYFKGLSAIKKLSAAAGVSEKQALIFLKKTSHMANLFTSTSKNCQT